VPDDVTGLRQEFDETLCLQSHSDDCVCANDPDVDLCACGHPMYRHWNYYGGLSGCITSPDFVCPCEHYVAAPPPPPLPKPPEPEKPVEEPQHPLPRARWVNGTWWARFRRFFEWP
jgi:hypothetical protein